MDINNITPNPAHRERALRRLNRANDLRGDAFELLNFLVEQGTKHTRLTITADDAVVLREALIKTQTMADLFYDVWRERIQDHLDD